MDKDFCAMDGVKGEQGKDFCFVMGVEDMPYKAQLSIESQWKEMLPQLFKDVAVVANKCTVHASCRHIVISCKLPDRSDRKECLGPKVGVSQDVVDAFVRKNDLRDCVVRSTPRGERWVGYIPGRHTAEVITSVINDLIDNTTFAYVMRSHSWIRPTAGVVCMYDKQLLKCVVRRIGVTTGSKVVGHAEYGEINFGDHDPMVVLHENGLEVDFAKKYSTFCRRLSDAGCDVSELCDVDLMYENIRTVSDPIPIICNIPEQFAEFPREFLTVPMVVHQKLVPCTDKMRFVAVANYGVLTEQVRRNVERVMHSRLGDMQEFYDRDTSQPLEFHLNRLSERIIFPGLGTYADRVNRVYRVLESITGVSQRTLDAAKVLYCDLFTAMIEEFPELEGTAARVYLGAKYDRAESGVLIEQAMWPRNEGDQVPAGFTKDAALLSWVRRLDGLVGFALLDKLPSGSKDPLCLRREGLGFVRVGFELQPDVEWQKLAVQLAAFYKIEGSAALEKLEQFIHQRLLYVVKVECGCPVMAQELVNARNVWTSFDRAKLGIEYYAPIKATQVRLRNLSVVSCLFDGEINACAGLELILQKARIFTGAKIWKEKVVVLRDLCNLVNEFLDQVHIADSPHRDEYMYALGMVLGVSEEYICVK
jgi:glycyl-tRNA synthetase beta chain